jgi:pseudouridine-5'-phosphate glycosidase
MSTTHMSLTHLLHVFTSGAIPATIAIINGFPKIGLTSSELKLLAQPSSDARSPVIKASRRDVAYACAHRLNAGL